ncbi:hypothetical protein DVA86_19355 [Streptomyces armeniacus]|uniref:Uncharacterized protein n=1 Tax=Streptomyces armeniacus TaxID=83291 RepID=A0A345Y0R0_9ACTN|nr:hypothetical protein DVA86_19355 [Streptomyces armeniacus]
MTWPPVAQTGDGNAWVTGACWLYCRREGVRVLWVGSVRTPGATGDVYACGPCIAELDRMVREESYGRDPAGAAGTTTCEHRRLAKRGGKTHCRDCERQLYL